MAGKALGGVHQKQRGNSLPDIFRNVQFCSEAVRKEKVQVPRR